MTWAWAATVCLVLSVAVAVSSPAAALARLRAPGVDGDSGWRWLRGRPGAPSLTRRVLAGLAVAAASWWLLASWWGLPAGLVAGAAVTLALGHVVGEDPVQRALGRQLPEALELLAAAIEAGAPVSRATAVVAAASPAATSRLLGTVASHLELGRSASDVWMEVAGQPVWHDAALDLARAGRSGTPVEEALRIHAEQARLRRQETATANARRVGVRSMVPLMVCFLPAFLLVGVVPIIAGLLAGILG